MEKIRDTEAMNRIPFIQIFDKLWIKTFQCWNWTLWLYDNWERTSGWKLNINENLVNDFTNKRANGDVISFVKTLLNIDFDGACDWLEDNFILTAKNDYLTNRKINSNALNWILNTKTIKDKEYISCAVKNGNNEIIWTQNRTTSWKFFMSEWKDWFFYEWIKENEDFLFIVEWMTDFFTLRQFTSQVIWFRSCTTTITDDIKKIIDNHNTIYLYIDNDEPWKKAKEAFKEKIIGSIIIEIDWDKKEDMNDLLLSLWDEDFIEKIKKLWKQTRDIEQYLWDFNRFHTIYRNTRKRKADEVVSWGYKEFDTILWWMRPWDLYLIWWLTWKWKSTFIRDIASKIWKQGFKVLLFSLEESMLDIIDIENFHTINMFRIQAWLVPYRWENYSFHDIRDHKFHSFEERSMEYLDRKYKNITCFYTKTQATIDDIIRHMNKGIQKGIKVFFIDHLHYMKMDMKKERNDLVIGGIAQTLKNFAVNNWVVIILVAHYTKPSWKDKEPNNYSFSGSWIIPQVADTIIHVTQTDIMSDFWLPETKFVISKKRSPWWTWLWYIVWHFDPKTGTYDMEISYRQLKREQLYL